MLTLTQNSIYLSFDVFVIDHLEEDPISETTSGESCSVGGIYRMNDVVGLSDVQQMARLQEESKYSSMSSMIEN